MMNDARRWLPVPHASTLYHGRGILVLQTSSTRPIGAPVSLKRTAPRYDRPILHLKLSVAVFFMQWLFENPSTLVIHS